MKSSKLSSIDRGYQLKSEEVELARHLRHDHVEQNQVDYHSFHQQDVVPFAADRKLAIIPISSSLDQNPIVLSEQMPSGDGHPDTLSASAMQTAGSLAIQRRPAGFRSFSFSGRFSDELGQLLSQLQTFLSDQVAPIRLASHLAVLAVATVVILVSQVELPNWEFSLPSLSENEHFLANADAEVQAQSSSLLGSSNLIPDSLQRTVVPFTPQSVAEPSPIPLTVQPDPTSLGIQNIPAPVFLQSANTTLSNVDEIQLYTVRSGDTVLRIADRYGLKPDTILWANPKLEPNPDMLRVGDRLVILPVDGVLHVVRRGDTLSSIATKYKVTNTAIADYPLNKLESVNTPITIGKQLVIPNGKKPYIPRQIVAYQGEVPASASKGSKEFGWPTTGVLTQKFWNGHRAIDIGARTGTPIVAADHGYVVVVAHTDGGYGRMVMVDHGNGYVSLYAHMDSIFVRQGENVAKGQELGTVGNTGYSSGPHLHFEIRYQGVARNPFNYLP